MFVPIALDEFRARTGIVNGDLSRGWHDAERVTSLRDMCRILDVRAMSFTYLRALLENIPLTGEREEYPYRDCRITTSRIDPNRLRVGQTFIERGKCQSFLEDFEDIFEGYCITKGPAKCTAFIVLGEDAEGALAVAHYLPPIIEVHEGDLLLDGMHRNYLVKQVGTTLESIIIEGVKPSFPCTPNEWRAVRPVDAKPPKEERFFNLRPNLFRDLKFIGVDG